jgi:hypothetical protein
MSDRDEDHREPRGSFDNYLRERGYCPACSRSLDKRGVCVSCDPEPEAA